MESLVNWINEGVEEVKDWFSSSTSEVEDAVNTATSNLKIENSVTSAMSDPTGLIAQNSQPAVAKVDSNADSSSEKSTGAMASNRNAVGIDNPLNKFASFNYIWSLFALSDSEVIDPANTYRVKDPKISILRSGGGVQTRGGAGFENLDNKYEFFIDNVHIDLQITPNQKIKQTNASSIRFEVFEPYSMGMFPLSLMQAAKEAKDMEDVNYLAHPYLLVLDFVGWDDNGNQVPADYTRKLRRFFPINIQDLKFDVKESGSRYTIIAAPWVEQAKFVQRQSLLKTYNVKGRTVKEMCQTGLYCASAAFNKIEQDKKKDSQDPNFIPDEFLILFPKIDGEGNIIEEKYVDTPIADKPASNNPFDFGGHDGRATNTMKRLGESNIKELYKSSVSALGEPTAAALDNFRKVVAADEAYLSVRTNVGDTARAYAEAETTQNDISKAKMVDKIIDNVTHPFYQPFAAELLDKPMGKFDRSRLSIPDGQCQLNFNAGTTLQDMIEEIILMSEYGRQLMMQTPVKGYYKWFRVDTQVYPTKKTIVKSTGRAPQLYVYRVYPTKIHESRWNAITSVQPTTDLYANCAKVYNYIYTGKNTDILNFEIVYNHSYFAAISEGYDSKFSSQTQNVDSRSANGVETNFAPNEVQGGESTAGHKETNKVKGPGTGKSGGGGGEKTSTSVARDWNDLYLESGNELITVDLEILGDPYFVSDSGMGNYHARPTQHFNINSDGAMNFENGEVHIVVNFRTPLDFQYNNGNTQDGYMKFQDESLQVKSFSGVYQVINVQCEFTEGKFVQKLRCSRVHNQKDMDVESGETGQNVKTAESQQVEASIEAKPVEGAGAAVAYSHPENMGP